MPGKKNIKARQEADSLMMRDFKKMQIIKAMKYKVQNGD